MAHVEPKSLYDNKTAKMKLFLGLILVCRLATGYSADSGIVGSRTPCFNEGEKIEVPIQNVNCFSCICKNGFVECDKECPSQDGCHMLLGPPPGGCCKKCKGCLHEGVERASGEEWRDPDNPCRLYVCKAGVVTETEEQCYAPCRNPQPPKKGLCCPTCPGKIGCKVNGQDVSAGRTVRSLDDPCLKCSCNEGRFSCSKRACPVLNCPNIMPPKPGECCPYCNGSREVYPPPQGRCLLGADLKLSGEDFHHDSCTLCHCENGTSLCRRPSCAPLDCPQEMQITLKDRCCPYCPQRPPYPMASASCKVGDHVYKDGESWEVNPCKACSCKAGKETCVEEMCTESNKPCPLNHKLVTIPGQCCAKCVESDGVCTVFGDPHYRTFDGKFFSFQGSCKYQLAADCANQTFSIRVTNDGRGTKTSSWTKTVSMKLNGMKVNLGEKRRVKINGMRVPIPYETRAVTVTNTDDWVLVETMIGVKLLWDGDSFLELSVPPKYKGKLCGLCGNFNSISRDDMTTRRGQNALEAADVLGTSWRVGGKRACSRPYEAPQRCSKSKRYRERICKHLRSDIFAECHKELNNAPYYKSCQKDMCECPSQRCYCESFTAYARECERLGVRLHDWKMKTGCLHH